ncbi:hypothetical protein Rsub_00510 [Raphidocelis subcapitata]|uniref:CARDB domain-containing protein n=1 Tax=Raphidocelis subcapitata TaxID=307507 RepID=A0A2V0NL57_9CHLO|nr:hypothetical protein Rsub_00510 [Raphidocelis subcapitata]|eukprot:GBF87799.1 hypothetical protein Rsub_00510 [Raphidocelis subcapitata]
MAVLLLLLLAVLAAAPAQAFPPFANPLSWYSSYFDPYRPMPGDKMSFIIWVQNISPERTEAGTVAVWANKPEDAKCGEKGDKEFKVPPLDPLQSVAVKAFVKVPDAVGTYTVRTFVDSGCTIFANSSLEPTGFDNAGNQRDRTYSVVDAKEAVVGQPRSPPLDMPRGGPYVEGSVRTPDLEPALPLFGQPFKAFVKVANWGTAPLEPGVQIAVWPAAAAGFVPSCGAAGAVIATLPKKLGPGKETVVEVPGLVTSEGDNNLVVLVDANCSLSSDVGRSGRVAAFQYEAAADDTFDFIPLPPAAYLFTGKVKISPKSPPVNGTMKIKAKFTNAGTVDQAPGRVAIWLRPLGPDTLYGYSDGDWCDFKNTAAIVTLDAPVIKAGKSKMLTIDAAPVPDEEGTFVVSLVAAGPVADCGKLAGLTPQPVYAAAAAAAAAKPAGR